MVVKLILASASPRRAMLLKQVGFEPDVIEAAEIDETPIPGELPKDYCARVALEKAIKVSQNYSADCVLAADSIVAVGRRILGKPQNEEEACKFYRLLSGRSNCVMTSVVICKDKIIKKRLVVTKVLFKNITTEEINLLLRSNEWHDKCGGYSIQGMAGRLVRKIIGTPSNALGLPLFETVNLLESFGLKSKI